MNYNQIHIKFSFNQLIKLTTMTNISYNTEKYSFSGEMFNW